MTKRDVLDSVRDWLRISYRVITFQRSAEALEYLKGDQLADVILCDQRMPEMTGVEVLCQAKAIRPETTRLLFTAYTDIRTVIDAINEGHVFRYIAKPCDPDELAVVVRQAVEHHDLIVEKNRLLAELQESNARLLEANRLKGAFIEVASHELNTPVTVMLGMIELWKMSQAQNASPVERQWVDRIDAAAGRLARTVERMLKLVRNREFGQSVDAQPIELEPLVRQAIEDLSPILSVAPRLCRCRSSRTLVRSRPTGPRFPTCSPTFWPTRSSSRRMAGRFGSKFGPSRREPTGFVSQSATRERACPRPTSNTFSNRFLRVSTRSATPPATTSSASAGLVWALAGQDIRRAAWRTRRGIQYSRLGHDVLVLAPRSPAVLSGKAGDEGKIRFAGDALDGGAAHWPTAV